MSGGNSDSERDMMSRIRAVIDCEGKAFADVLKAARIDPKRGLRYRNLSGLSFEGQDLRGMDFTGANIAGCNFSDSLIDGACFDRGLLGNFARQQLYIADISGAHDFSTYKKNWKLRKEIELPEYCEGFLGSWDVFSDSPLLPTMVVLPSDMLADEERMAVSCKELSITEFKEFEDWQEHPYNNIFGLPDAFPVLVHNWSSVNRYVEWASKISGREYSTPSEHYSDLLWDIEDEAPWHLKTPIASSFAFRRSRNPRWQHYSSDPEQGCIVAIDRASIDGVYPPNSASIRLVRHIK